MKKILIGAALLTTMLISACSTPEVKKTPEPQSLGMANPASVYCNKVGGTSIVKKDSRGNEVGYCRLADGKVVEEWELFRSAQQEDPKAQP